VLRDDSGITQLDASGLPLGIFSHATQSASTCALEPGAALLLVSRGIVEAERDGQEFGLEGAKKNFLGASALRAPDLCLAILQSAEEFVEAAPTHNDVTALVLLRCRNTDRPGSRASGRKLLPYGRTGKRK
jgi:serine phosphatase RsbU (regulator of sigma subunit)